MSFPSQGYVPTTIPLPRLRSSITNVVVIVDQEWFASDIIPEVDDDFGSDLIFVFTFSERANISVSYDSGATWFLLNNNNKIEAETLNSFAIPVLNTDLINFRSDTAGTIRIARVLEEI